jgi:hypothetical protein
MAQPPCCVFPNLRNERAAGRAVGDAFFGAIDVLSAEEFYKNADEHFGWAESAKTERERAIFLQMAAAWLEVAQKWDGVNVDASRDLPRGRPS